MKLNLELSVAHSICETGEFDVAGECNDKFIDGCDSSNNDDKIQTSSK